MTCGMKHKAASIVLLLAMSAPSHALYEDDVHISTDRDAISEDVNGNAYNEIRAFLEQGYPVQSVYLHGVALGFSIDDIVFMAVRARPTEAGRFVDVALDMLPTLPTWACRDDSQGAAERFAPVATAGDDDQVTPLAEITRRFFEDNVRLSPFPDWESNHVHLRVPTEDLAEQLGDGYWYRNDAAERPVNSGVMVSLYRHENEVVVDGNLGQVADAIERGDPSVPVVVIYNDKHYRPMSDFGDGPTMSEVVSAYLGEELKVTHVPDWRAPYSDFHHVARIAEFEEFVTLPSPEQIEEGRWNRLLADLDTEGFSRKPVIVSMYYDGGRVFVDQPDRLTAARELGMDPVPVVYLYHSIARLPCGVAPGDDCEERIRTAADLAAQRTATATR